MIGPDGEPVRIRNGKGERIPKRVPVLDERGEPVRAKARRRTIEYTDGDGRTRRKVGYTDKVASEQLAAKLERHAARRKHLAKQGLAMLMGASKLTPRVWRSLRAASTAGCWRKMPKCALTSSA